MNNKISKQICEAYYWLKHSTEVVAAVSDFCSDHNIKVNFDQYVEICRFVAINLKTALPRTSDMKQQYRFLELA